MTDREAAERMRRALLRIIGDLHPPGADAYEACRAIAAEALGFPHPGPMPNRVKPPRAWRNPDQPYGGLDARSDKPAGDHPR